MIQRQLLMFLLVLLIFMGGASAYPYELWNKTFGGTDYDAAHSVQQTSDGGYVLAGSTGPGDAWLIKTDANGDLKWSKTFGGADSEYANSVQQTSDGGYILAGTAILTGSEYSVRVVGQDAWLIKTDANGDLKWSKTFGGTDIHGAYSVQQTSDGGYILAGFTDWSGPSDAWLIKTDANGDLKWSKTFGGMSYDLANSVQQTSDGGYILAGYTISFGAGEKDAWLIKTDANGIQQWSKTFGGTSYDLANSVQQTSDGGYILAGYITSNEGQDAWLIKTDANGIQQWSKTFGGTENEYAHSVQQTSDGGYILAGFITSNEGQDAWLIKTDANGDEQWNLTFGKTNDDVFRSVQQTSDGDFILAGSTLSYDSDDWDAWLVKVSSETIKQIDTCTVISSPGEYKLTQSIIDSADLKCIEITSNDVIFDGAGYTIDGDSYPYSEVLVIDETFGLAVYGSTNVTVKNLRLTDWDFGIYYLNADKGFIINNSASAISVTGILVDSSNYNTITNNSASNSDYGINIRSSNFITLTNNTVSNNYYAIRLWDSFNNILENNFVSNSEWGIALYDSSSNALTDNIASNNDYGIRLKSSNYNHLTGNTANYNNYIGIFISSSSSNILTSNSALGNLQWDFNSDAGSINNDVIDFNIDPTISFTSKDVKIKSSSSPASDPLGYCSINKYIKSTNNNADSWLFLNVNYDDNDVKDVKENTLSMWKHNGTWSQVSGTNGVNTAQNYVYANITSFSIFAPMADVPPASVTNLHNITYAPTYINWTWTDPVDADFAGVMVYLDHVFKTNVSKGVQYYNATGLNPAKNYTISTKTVDSTGNINQTSVDNTSRTSPSSGIIEPINITIISPANKSINTTGDVNVTVVLDRAGTALLNWNGVNESMNGADKNFYKLQEDLLSGNFNFKVYAIDSKGVSSVSETRILTVNRTKTINLSIDPETGNVSKKIISIAPSENVKLTIFNGTNVSGCDENVTKIFIDSPDQLNATLEEDLDTGEIFLWENFSALPNCSRFNPDIQLQFNYTDEQLEAAKIDESNVAVKFYNTTRSKWEDLELYERNEALNYIIVNVSHFSIISLIGQVPSPTPPRGGGGGGGGGGTSGEAFDNILISETEREYVNKDSKVIYSFDMEGNIVQHINFTGVTNSGEVAARVEILKNTSTLVENPPPDVIYKNLNIWVGNAGWATSKNIVEPTINFRVEKFWVSENNIDESTIRLICYTDGTWNPLITSKIYEDADNLYFEGETIEFSPFAVSGKYNLPGPGGFGGEASVEESPVQTSTEKESGMPGFSLLICLMSLLIGAYILQKK